MHLNSLKGKRALVVVSSGGHLLEAFLLVQKLKLSESSIYVSHYNPQSFSLLENKQRYFVPKVQSRDWKGAIRCVPHLVKISLREDFDIIISTGAAIAISALPIKYLFRKPYFFFDSLTRLKAPSMTGKIIEKFKSVEKYSEHAANFGPEWKKSPSILENFNVTNKPVRSGSLKILVTLGTIPNFRFDRLINSVLSVIEPGDVIYWQLGSTDRKHLPGLSLSTISNLEMMKIANKCDVVISHCGIGTILDLLSLGIRPIVLPRESRLNEHVDDHQVEAATLFANLDLVQIMNGIPMRQDLYNASSKYISNL